MYGICLEIDPERRLQSVTRTRIHWDIGDTCKEYASITEAEEEKLRFKNWAWRGTKIIKIEPT